MKRIRLFIHKHRIFTCGFILFGFLFYLSYTLYQKDDLWGVEKVLRDSLASIQNVITPKLEVHYQDVVDIFTKEKEEELENLRSLLDLTNQSSFSLEHASILSRDALSYFDILTINKGKSSGIDRGMLAINEKGLVGVVEYVSSNTSTIRLLTNGERTFKIAVSVHYGENVYNGIITGFDQEKQEIVVTSIRNQSNIEVGSSVITNGLGNLYPEGVEVGTVSRIEVDDAGVSKRIYVKSENDFRNIKYVSIIKGAKS